MASIYHRIPEALVGAKHAINKQNTEECCPYKDNGTSHIYLVLKCNLQIESSDFFL